MVTPWHAGDFRKVPDQEGARKAIGALKIPPGDYCLPRPDNMKDMKSPGFLNKLREGPRLVFTVLPNETANMGKMLAMWFWTVIRESTSSSAISRLERPAATSRSTSASRAERPSGN